MALESNIQFPEAKVAALFDQIDRASRELGKGIMDSLKWGGTLLCKSLGAQTKVAPKLRPVVRNPNPRWKTDRRVAPFGVYRWDKSGAKVFKPIYRTGEYGSIRFFDKKSFSWYNRFHGENKWQKIPSGPDIANPEIIAPGIMSDKRRVIGRRGLAKQTWSWAAAAIHRGGVGSVLGVPNVASVTLMTSDQYPAIAIRNNLRYAEAAMMAGAVEAAITNAGNKMAHLIDQKLQKKMDAK